MTNKQTTPILLWRKDTLIFVGWGGVALGLINQNFVGLITILDDMSISASIHVTISHFGEGLYRPLA